MLIEILEESGICKVEDEALKSYLEYSLERLPEDFDYFNHAKEYGYFVVVTELEDLIGTCIELKYFHLPSMNSDTYFEQVELIETTIVKDVEIMEILVHVDTDVTVSFIFKKEILSAGILEMVHGFIYE